MTDEQIQEWKSKIDKMTQLEMASIYRFAPAGHPCFDTSIPLNKYFMDRFHELGGMTTAISKTIGWGK